MAAIRERETARCSHRASSIIAEYRLDTGVVNFENARTEVERSP